MAPKKSWAKAYKHTTPQTSGWTATEDLSSSAQHTWWDESGAEIAQVQPINNESSSSWDPYEKPKVKLTPEEEAEEKDAAEKAAIKARVGKNLAGWPWEGAPRQLVTLGPLYLNTWHVNILEEGLVDQNQSFLMKALVTSGVGELIIDLLFQHHDTIWKFAHCCQRVHAAVQATLGFWDMNIAHFNGCQLPPTAQGDIEGNGSVATNLVVCPMRSPTTINLKKENTLYEGQLYNTYLLCKTVQYRAVNFRRLHLHKIPFLTTGLLSILIPEMTNLEVLGIYKCPLIHIGHGMELLHIISSDRPKGKEYQVSLDWFPNYHVGPDPSLCPTEYYTGSYGVTWDDWHGPTDRAIWALVLPFLARCKVHGIDAMSSYTQFRRWLEASPCWDVENTLKAFVSAWGLYVEGSDLFGKDEEIPTWAPEPRFPGGKRLRPLPRIDYETKWPKLSNAIILMDRRSPHHQGKHEEFFSTSRQLAYARPEGFEWMFKRYPCFWCQNVLEGVFFFYPDIKCYVESTNHGMNQSAPHDLTCLGCKLSQYLDTEKDHFKQDKRIIDQAWRFESVDEHGYEVYNTNDINKLVNCFNTGFIGLAVALDNLRNDRRNRYGFDREFEERQMPLTNQVKRSLRGNFLQAPQVGGWAKQLALKEERRLHPEMARWADGFRTSYLGHGRHHG